jgi:pimeloyl-ACP methyl ester carboxylesterase
MSRVQLNGIERFYQEAGSGDPLLLINGLTGTCLGWEPLVPALAERFRVITSDNRGVGRSAAPPGPYTTRQMADDAAALLAHLGIGRAHVVGSSMGGMIAQELALAYPQLVDRLVLYGTFARPRHAIMEPWLTFVVQMAERLDPSAVTLGWLPWLYTPAFFAQPEQVEAVLAWLEPYPAPAHGIAAQAEAVRSHDTLERLPQITAPTLVLVGAEDVVTPLYYSRELAERIPGATLQVLERGGHEALWEHPEAGIEALLKFLAPAVVDGGTAQQAL